MERTISEPDWREFRQLHPVARDRFCLRILAELGRFAVDDGTPVHDRYLAAWELMGRRNQELADTFDDLRRSTALAQLARMRAHDLVTEAEVAGFSPEARDVVQRWLTVWDV